MGRRRSRWGRPGVSPWRGPIAGMEAGVGVTTLPDALAAHDAVDFNTVQTAIIIPPGFSDAAAAGGGTSVEQSSATPMPPSRGGLARSAPLWPSPTRSRRSVQPVAQAASRQASYRGWNRPRALASWHRVTPTRSAPSSRTPPKTAPPPSLPTTPPPWPFVFLGAQFGVTSLLTEKRTTTLSRMVSRLHSNPSRTPGRQVDGLDALVHPPPWASSSSAQRCCWVPAGEPVAISCSLAAAGDRDVAAKTEIRRGPVAIRHHPGRPGRLVLPGRAGAEG